MPHERLRAIGWGRQLLLTLQTDPLIPEELKSTASRIAMSYPSVDALLELVESGTRDFPAAAGASIEEASHLFDEVRTAGAGSSQTQRELMYTMRHFPTAGWAQTANWAALAGKLDRWLARG